MTSALVTREPTTTLLTFSELCQLEPRLTSLRDEVLTWHAYHKPYYCANEVWYGYGMGDSKSIKRRMAALVGYKRNTGPDELRTALAYEVAYNELYWLLPNCRGECLCP